MPLINSRTIKNASEGYIPVDGKKIRFYDIKDGMVVNIKEDNKTNEMFLVAATKNTIGKISIDVDDYDGDLILVKPDDIPQGFTFWRFDQFRRNWPRHIDWGDDVVITKVWRTHIDTSEMDPSKLKRIMNDILDKLQD